MAVISKHRCVKCLREIIEITFFATSTYCLVHIWTWNKTRLVLQTATFYAVTRTNFDFRPTGYFSSSPNKELLEHNFCRLDHPANSLSFFQCRLQNGIYWLWPVGWFAVMHRTVRVWIKRNTGHYWPSICHTMPGKSELTPLILTVTAIIDSSLTCLTYCGMMFGWNAYRFIYNSEISCTFEFCCIS